jgi:ABC-type Mn2+/Zn2+ transport system permease subunit
MKKFFEYVCVCSAVLGTLVMIGAVGSIETDKWLQGGAMALLGTVMFILSLYAQEESK